MFMRYATYQAPRRPGLLGRPRYVVLCSPPRRGWLGGGDGLRQYRRLYRGGSRRDSSPGGSRRRAEAPRDRRARGGVRPFRALPHPGQRAPGRGLPAERRRRADPAGHLGHRGGARHGCQRRGTRFHRRRQRPGAVRRGVSRTRAGAADHHAHPRSQPAARRLDRLSRGARPAGSGEGERLQHQSRTLGNHVRRRLDA